MDDTKAPQLPGMNSRIRVSCWSLINRKVQLLIA